MEFFISGDTQACAVGLEAVALLSDLLVWGHCIFEVSSVIRYSRKAAKRKDERESSTHPLCVTGSDSEADSG